MAASYQQQYLAVLRRNEAQLGNLFQNLADLARGVLVGAAGGEDVAVPPGESARLRAQIGASVTSLFLVQVSDQGDLAAYTVTAAGDVVPMSSYFRVLWGSTGSGTVKPSGVQGAATIAVQRHAALMHRYLRNADDVRARLLRATRDPFAPDAPVAQQIRTNPLASYDPLHRFVHPDGYRLSDRIWRVAADTRRRIDLLLEERIRQGQGALALSRDLEAFLKPGRGLVRTAKPYGTDASYDAMRLARTEITAAHMQAGRMAAYMNPFVTGAEYVLSPSHGCCDICDDYAAGSPYTLDALPDIPGDTHPHCMCRYRWTVTDSPAAEIEALREEPEQMDWIGPLLVSRFVQLLLRDPDAATA